MLDLQVSTSYQNASIGDVVLRFFYPRVFLKIDDDDD